MTDPTMPRVALACAPGLLREPRLAGLLGVDRICPAERPPVDRREVCVLSSGSPGERRRAAAHARMRGLPVLHVGQGWLGRRVGSRSDDLSLSVFVDDLASPHDASVPSRLERLLSAPDATLGPLDEPALAVRARRCIDAIVAGRISCVDGLPDRTLGALRDGCRERVLVLASPHDDGAEGSRPALDREVLAAALRDHPDAEIAVYAPRRQDASRSPLFDVPESGARVRVVAVPTHAASLFDQVDRVYTTTSVLGFEALFRGKPVTVFGQPFYAGWGLTDDRVPIPRRTRKCSLEQVFAAAYVLGSRYLDPETGLPCEIERVIEHLALQRRFVEPEGRELFATGFSPWKQVFLPAFLGAPTNRVRFGSWYPNRPLPAPDPARRIVVWGVREDAIIANRGVADDIYRMEDGFLRSVGLGSDAHAPASLVVDSRGVYFDPTRPSDLEHMLETATFTPDELARAAKLRETIVALNVSKYNVGTLEPLRLPPSAKGRRVIMAIGQVEDDASIQRGCIDVRKNGDLVAAVREKNPEAFLIYKPHPDVTSGNRQGHVPEAVTKKLCDMVVVDVGVGACLAVVDEVHTLTSLVGFEALLRGLHVSVYGHPFYAGWGLTDDRHPHPRRTRKRTLDELVAATLIRYPRYVHPKTGLFTTPEAIVRDLVEQRAKAAPPGPFEHAWIVRRGRKLLYILSRGRHGR